MALILISALLLIIVMADYDLDVRDCEIEQLNKEISVLQEQINSSGEMHEMEKTVSGVQNFFRGVETGTGSIAEQPPAGKHTFIVRGDITFVDSQNETVKVIVAEIIDSDNRVVDYYAWQIISGNNCCQPDTEMCAEES